MLSGCLSVLVGVALTIWPGTGALAVVFLIGIYAIAVGTALLSLGWRMRSLHRALAAKDSGISPSHRTSAA